MTSLTDTPVHALAERSSGSWTVLAVILSSAEYLIGKGVSRGRLDAEHLLAHALGTERLQLYLEHDRPLVSEELDLLRPLLKRRAQREPLQYILGRQPFRTLDLIVDRSVLIPRPETEMLVEEILSRVGPSEDRDLEALDIGTGTGAIALSLAREGPFGRVVATDISSEAIGVAMRNRAEAGLVEQIEFRQGAYFEPVAVHEDFDVVVSNPPYVAEDVISELEPEVRDWEPADALFSGRDGLDAVRRIAAEAAAHIRASGLLALEVGSDQTERVAGMLEASGDYVEVRIRRDLTGRNRFVLARRGPPA